MALARIKMLHAIMTNNLKARDSRLPCLTRMPIPTCQSEVDSPLERQVNRTIVSLNIPRTFFIHSMVDSMNDATSNVSSDNNW